MVVVVVVVVVAVFVILVVTVGVLVPAMTEIPPGGRYSRQLGGGDKYEAQRHAGQRNGCEDNTGG